MFSGLLLIAFCPFLLQPALALPPPHDGDTPHRPLQGPYPELTHRSGLIIKVDHARAFASPTLEIFPPKLKMDTAQGLQTEILRRERETFSLRENGDVSHLAPVDAHLDVARRRLTERYDIEAQTHRVPVDGVADTANVENGRLLGDNHTSGRESVGSRNDVSKPDDRSGQQRAEDDTKCACGDSKGLPRSVEDAREIGYHELAEFLYGYLLGGLIVLLIVARNRSQKMMLAIGVILLISFG